MPICGFGFPHIRSDGEAVLHPTRKSCSSGIHNLSGMLRCMKKTKTKSFPLWFQIRWAFFPVLIEAALPYVRLNMAHRHVRPGSEGRDLPWPFLKCVPTCYFMTDFLFVALWFLHLLVEWVIRPSGASEGHVMGLNRSQHWHYFKATYTRDRPPSRGDNSLGGCALASGHTITLMASFHVSRSLRSFLADGGDKAVARSRLGRPAQSVYLCSAVPPHCCA